MTESKIIGRFKAIAEQLETMTADMQSERKLASSIFISAEQIKLSVESLSAIVKEFKALLEDNRTVELMTTAQAAEYFDKSPDTIRRWNTEGKLKGYRVADGGNLYFDRDEIKRILKGE